LREKKNRVIKEQKGHGMASWNFQKRAGSAWHVQNDNLFDSPRIYEIRYWIMNQVSLDGINLPIVLSVQHARTPDVTFIGPKEEGRKLHAKHVGLFYGRCVTSLWESVVAALFHGFQSSFADNFPVCDNPDTS